MKRLLTFVVATLAALTLASCPQQPNTLTLSPTSLSFAAGETDEKTIAVTTDAREWKAVSGEAWITVRQDGSALIVAMNGAHFGSESRQGAIIVSAGSAEPVTVAVTQEATHSLSVSPTTINYAAGETGSKSVTVTSTAPGNWTSTETADWLETTRSSDGKLVVTVNELNHSSVTRTAEITVTAGNATAVIVTVSQARTVNTLTLSPSSLEFGRTETGSKTVTVTTDASRWSATKSASWLSISITGSTLTVTVTEANSGSSARSADIIIEAGSETRTLTVTQGDGALAFGDIRTGSYTATGTPTAWTNPGPRTWTGTIRPNSSGQYYELTNFGGQGITVRLKFRQGKIYIDTTYKAAENSSANGYLRAFFDDDQYWYLMNENYEHHVDYNSSTRTLTFGKNITSLSYTPKAFVGVVALLKSDGEWEGLFTDIYADLSLRLTFTSSTRAAEDDPAPTRTIEYKTKNAISKPMRHAK